MLGKHECSLVKLRRLQGSEAMVSKEALEVDRLAKCHVELAARLFSLLCDHAQYSGCRELLVLVADDFIGEVSYFE